MLLGLLFFGTTYTYHILVINNHHYNSILEVNYLYNLKGEILMLAIYNETKTPWTVDNISEHVIRFSRVRQPHVNTKKAKTDEVVRQRSISIISYADIYNGDATRDVVQETIDSAEFTPTVITEKPLGIFYNDKAFQPFLCERAKIFHNVLLSSINLSGRRVVLQQSQDAALLEFMIFSDELSIIASFNKVGSWLRFTLANGNPHRQIQPITYTFTNTESGIVITVDELQTPVPEPKSHIVLRKYRPARPTHAVLVKASEVETLKKVLDEGKNPSSSFRLEIYDENNIGDVVSALKAVKYRAVTLYVDKPIAQKDKADKDTCETIVMELLGRAFLTVMKLYNDGEVAKIKF